MRRGVVVLAAVALAACACAAYAAEEAASAGELLLNNTGTPASGITVTFSDAVRIKWYDVTAFPNQDPLDQASSFTFAGGQVPAGAFFELRWVPSTATIAGVEWQADTPALEQGRLNLANLQASVDAASAASAVTIAAGLYVGNLTIAKPLVIVAEAGATLFGNVLIDLGQNVKPSKGQGSGPQPGPGSGSGSGSGSGTGSGGTSSPGSGDGGDSGSGTASSAVLISGLDVIGSITIQNTLSVVLNGVTVSDSPGAGVSIVNATVTISGSSISGSLGPGIAASQGSVVTVSGTTLSDNANATSAEPGSTINEEPFSPGTDGVAPDQHSLSAAAEGAGTVTPSTGTYAYGTAVEVLASPEPGWEFVEWGGDLAGSENPATVTMDGDKAVTAVFAPVDLCRVPYGTLSLDCEDIGHIGDPISNLANIVVELMRPMQVVITADLVVDTCRKTVFEGNLEAGQHVLSLASIYTDGYLISLADGSVVFRLHPIGELPCLQDLSVTGSILYWEETVLAEGHRASVAAYPLGVGTRIRVRDGDATVSQSTAFNIGLAFCTGSNPCAPLATGTCPGQSYELYLDGVQVATRRAVSPYTMGAADLWWCAWIADFAPYSLSIGEHRLRQVADWQDQLTSYHREDEMTLVVTE